MTNTTFRRATRFTTASVTAIALSFALAACGDSGDAAPGPDSSVEQDLGLIQPGVLTIASLRAQVPMASVDGSGEPIGFAVALTDEIAGRLDLETQYTVVDVAPGISGVVTGKYDIMTGATVETDERKETMGFSLGWYWAPSQFVNLNETTFASTNDLKGKTVGVVNATAQLALLESSFPDISPQIFSDQTSAITALKGNQVDAVFLGGLNAQIVIETEPSVGAGPEVPTEIPSGFVLPKDNPALISAVDDAIKATIEDGTFLELWNEHVPFPPSDEAIAAFPELAG